MDSGAQRYQSSTMEPMRQIFIEGIKVRTSSNSVADPSNRLP